jgi:heat shock protein HslJ
VATARVWWEEGDAARPPGDVHHRRRVWIILGIIVVLLLAALGDALTFGGLPLSSDVAESSWTLEDYTSGGAPVQIPSGVSAFIVFERVGHDFSGSDGCNSYFGKFSSLWPGHIHLSNLGQTLIGCPDDRGAFEARFLTDLLKVDSYRTNSSGSLVLSGDHGQVQIHYTAGDA